VNKSATRPTVRRRHAVWLLVGLLLASLMVGAILLGVVRFFRMLDPIAGGAGSELVVENGSPSAIVVEVSDYRDGTRYYLVAPNEAVTVDTVAHVNPPAERVRLLGPDCTAGTSVRGSYASGGIITVAADGSVRFVADRTSPSFRMGGLPEDAGHETCEEATSGSSFRPWRSAVTRRSGHCPARWSSSLTAPAFRPATRRS
jgi:hypothetical protein